MNITLASLAVLALVIVGGLVAFGRRERKAGRDEISAKVTEKTVDILRKQDAAAAESSKTKDSLVDRFRKAGF